ncbi:hypothetical protein GBN32_10200 [Plesiomonas shigelloides]|nr:hypothetical protein GBN32_10200 [Plesiomonas shigelloides]
MRTTPPHLQPVLSRIRRYVEKMPEGATLTQISQKVKAYSMLDKKDREKLVSIIRENGQLVVANEGRTTTLHHPKFGYAAVCAPQSSATAKLEDKTVVKKPVTPEELRQQAQELMRAAEEAERKLSDRAEIKKQLEPLKLEVLQAYGMASRKFDEFVDAMADMGKAVQKLKQITL